MNAQTDPHHGSAANTWGCLDNGFSIFYQTICSIHFVIIRKFRGRGAPYQNIYKLLKTIEIQRVLLRFNKGDEASKPLKYSVFYCIIRDRGVPYRNTYNMLKINGFEAAAPCKGKGISAQGKADRRAATPWVSPMTRV